MSDSQRHSSHRRYVELKIAGYRWNQLLYDEGIECRSQLLKILNPIHTYPHQCRPVCFEYYDAGIVDLPDGNQLSRWSQ